MSVSFNPEEQYRCTIARGRSLSSIDDLLPAYATIVTEICPCKKSVFKEHFDKEIVKYVSANTKKARDNHRTEISGKLFGMWWEDENENIHASKRTEKLLVNRDHPEFFKDVVSKFQFPK